MCYYHTLVKQEKQCFSCIAEELSYLLVLTEKVNISCFLSKKCNKNLN